MTKWIRRLIFEHSPTPEKAATSMLVSARMQLFTAEQRVLDAEIQREYWRARVRFLEDVQRDGVKSLAANPSRPIFESKGQPNSGPRLATGS